MHIAALRELGGDISPGPTQVAGRWLRKARVHDVELAAPSAGATVNTVLAVHGRGERVTVTNVPDDPDLRAMYTVLEACGTQVEATGGAVRIDATARRAIDEVIEIACPPDPNDAFTWMAAGAISSAAVEVAGAPMEVMSPAVQMLRSCGAVLDHRGSRVRVQASDEGIRLPPGLRVIGGPSPGFPSDWLPLLQVVLCLRDGGAETIDALYPNRTRGAELLREMGAPVVLQGGPPPAGVELHFDDPAGGARYRTTIQGRAQLRGRELSVGNDVRACAAIALAATSATGTTTLHDVAALARGYEGFPERLRCLGVEVDWRGDLVD
jgi:UDP-N-acetylglucosamine 1-carboxyvinyltransferase